MSFMEHDKNIIIQLGAEPLLEVLGENGERWHSGPSYFRTNSMCLYGAMRKVCEPGDAYLIEAVGKTFGFGTPFNDTNLWTDVRNRIDRGFEISEGMLLSTFGFGWEKVVGLVRQIASLRNDEFNWILSEYEETLENNIFRNLRTSALGKVCRASYMPAMLCALDLHRHDPVLNSVEKNVMGVVAGVVSCRSYPNAPLTESDYDFIVAPYESIMGNGWTR